MQQLFGYCGHDKKNMKICSFILLLFLTTTCCSQPERERSTFGSVQVNRTLYDQRPFYKAGIAGLGIQWFSSGKRQVTPTLEINADLINRQGIGAADEPMKKIVVMTGVYIGPSFHPTDRLFIAATVGSTFSEKAYFGVRPCVGYYPTTRRKWFAKVSYTNVFQQARFQDKDFGYLSFAVSLKL